MLLHHPHELLIVLAAIVIVAVAIRIVIGNPMELSTESALFGGVPGSTCGQAPATRTSSNSLCAGHGCVRSASAAVPARPCPGGHG